VSVSKDWAERPGVRLEIRTVREEGDDGD
jgi:hypothetical protein